MDLIYNRGSAADQWERIDFPIEFWFLIMVYSILHPATLLKEFPTVTHTPHSLPSMPSSSQLLKCTRRMPPSKPLSNWSFCMAWFAPDVPMAYPLTAFIFCSTIIFSEWFSLTCLSKIGIYLIFYLITLLHFPLSSTLSRWDEGLFLSPRVPSSWFITWDTVFPHKYMLDIWIKYTKNVHPYWYSKKTLQRRYHFSSLK